jgi:hypothetical protein
MWFYESGIGRFKIIRKDFNAYELWIDNIDLGLYDSPEAAAAAVYHQSTGWDEWDTSDTDSKPSDIGVWEEQW